MEYSKKTTISWYLIFISVITSLPLLFITGIVLKYSVNMPWQDDWTLFVPGIEDVFTGNISFKTLWVLEQDNKTFFFNIVAFAIIYFSKWQSFYFGLASILCNLIVFIILSLWIKRLLDFYKQGKLFYFAFPILSIILFSASYGINWVFNTILIIFITNAAVISLFYFLIQEKFRWKTLLLPLLWA